MLKVRLGLSRRRKVPIVYILDRIFLPHEALSMLWKSRCLKIKEQSEEYVIVQVKGYTLKLLNQYALWTIDEWKVWEKHYIPHFSLQGKTVLDVGAGCGETALLFFLYGAYKVIAVEPDVKIVKCLKENVERNNWNVEIIPEPFSLEHLKLDYDFMKVDGEGCEKLLLSIPKMDKPCVVEVHGNELLNEFTRKGWVKIHSMKTLHLVKNYE
jgi:methylase of polypeptide subunit release factors